MTNKISINESSNNQTLLRFDNDLNYFDKLNNNDEDFACSICKKQFTTIDYESKNIVDDVLEDDKFNHKDCEQKILDMVDKNMKYVKSHVTNEQEL